VLAGTQDASEMRLGIHRRLNKLMVRHKLFINDYKYLFWKREDKSETGLTSSYVQAEHSVSGKNHSLPSPNGKTRINS
jgi:hypothetical protein